MFTHTVTKDAAVMIYRTTSHVPLAGQEFTEELRIVETYVKRNGRWLLMARAESEIPNANRVPAKVAPELRNAFVGDYQISPGEVVRITRAGDSLMEQGLMTRSLKRICQCRQAASSSMSNPAF
jgi:hypothetical protein